MGTSVDGYLAFGIPFGAEEEELMPWQDEDDLEDVDFEDWLAKLYGFVPKHETDYGFSFVNDLNLPFEYDFAGHHEYAYPLVVIKESRINAYYSPKRIKGWPETKPEWWDALVDFARRAGLEESKIGWYLYASYG